MAIHVGIAQGPERTRALLEEIAGGRRGAQLRAQVARAKRGATREQIEEAFQEACLKAARSCRGQTMGEVYKWLLRTTDSTIDDMRDRLKREVLVDHSARVFQTSDPSLAPPEELLIKREEREELDGLTAAIFERLDRRERDIAVLHSHGFARKEIARHLGVTPRIVKRDVECILATGRDQLAKAAGCGCPDGHSLVCRYAFGLAAGREARRAQGHLAGCARCATMCERLDLWRERVAAVLPMPPAAVDRGALIERAVHAGGDALASGPSPTGGSGGLRQHVAHAAGHVRDQATGLLARAGDPTPLAGARPGAVAAAVAGCLAVGGGATYCVQQSTDPIGALTRIAAPSQRERPEKSPRLKRTSAVQTPLQAVTAPVGPPPPPPPPPPPVAPPAPAAATQQQLPPAPEDEFEPSSVSASNPPRRSTPSINKEPAAAPADGIGEFDGP